MAQPTAFTRLVDYTDDTSNNVSGRSSVRADRLDAEMDALVTTISQILTNIALNQRDDGNIRDGRVKLYTLADDVRVLIAAAGATFNAAGVDWLTATSYAVSNIVQQSGATYLCAVAHTSGTFSTDLAADKWILIANSPDTFSAGDISVTPAGSISSTDVQAALEELDDDVTDVAADVAALDTGKVDLSGDTMTGDLILADGTPDTSLSAVPKSYADAVPDGLNAGACYLTYVSATGIRLDPDNGNKIFINGSWYAIPSAGVSLSNGGLSSNTTYNIFAYISAGNITLEASATARATDSTYGHQIKNGDATRTLVGKVRTNASSQFTADLVISWFNRRRRQIQAARTSNTSTTSGTGVSLGLSIGFLSWGVDAVYCRARGYSYNSGAAYTYTYIGIDSNAQTDLGSANFSSTGATCAADYAGTVSDGYHTADVYGYVGGGTGNWLGAANAGGQRLAHAVEFMG